MRSFQSHLVWVLASIALATVGCGTVNTSGRNKAIEDALDQRYGFVQIPTGQMRITGDVLAYLRKVESAGLVSLREIPESYWDSFLTRTQGTGTPFEVTATPKLLDVAVAVAPPKPEDPPPKRAPGPLRVKVQEAKLDKIVTEEEYKGSLATPGEKHHLILGLYRRIPTSAASVVGGAMAGQDEQRFRFRCVVRYSEFKKEWSVVAIDAGTVDPEQWLTGNVK